MEFKEDLMVDERVNIKPKRFVQVLNFLKGLTGSNSVIYFIVTVLISSVSFLEVKPFAIILLSAATIFNVPLLLPLIGSIISFVIFKENITTVVNYGLAFLCYTTFVSIIEIDGYGKKITALIKIGVSTVISNIITYIIFFNKGFSVINGVTNILLTVAFFPVFTYGMSMLVNLSKKIVFSKEEIISLAVIVMLALIPFFNFVVLGFNIVNVLCMTLIMLIAWKNDWITGTSCGLVIGLLYAIITNQSTLIITMYAFSGFIAGVLNKQNKFVVAIVFVLGNLGLSFAFTRDIIVWSRLAELIVASSIILVLPKKLILKLEDLFGTSNCLTTNYRFMLGASKDAKDKLNAMSEVFDNLAHITTPVTEETIEETKSVIKKYLLDYKKNECISCSNRLVCLKDDIDVVSEHIAKRLEENKTITKEMLPIDCDLKQELLEEIAEIYSNMKLMRIVKQKENENNVKLANEYKSISKLIKNILRDDTLPVKSDTPEQKRIREELRFMGYTVYEDSYLNEELEAYYEFITDILIDIDKAKNEIQKIVSDIMGKKMNIKLVLNSSKTEKSRIKLVPCSKYVVKATVKQVRKADSSVSGDSYIVTELKDNSKVVAISDGMGSGEKSKEVSQTVISMIEKMGSSGFDKNEIIDIVNKLIKLKEDGEISATLDMCVVNEKKDVLEFIKLGAASSYLISDKNVIEINKDTMPVGLLEDLEYSIDEREIKKGDYIVLFSDGASSDINKESLENIFNEFKENDEITEKTIMDKIMKRIVGKQNKIILDDITVIVCKIA